MFNVLLICSDPACDHSDEFAGALGDADGVLCEGCDCLMQVVAVEGGHREAGVVDLAARRRRGAPDRLAA